MKNEIIKAKELLEELLLKEKELLTRTEIKETVLTKRLYKSIKELRVIECVIGSLPTDEEIELLTNGIETEWSGGGKVVFIRGAKWLRDKLCPYAEAKSENAPSNSCVSCYFFKQSEIGGFGNCSNKDFNRFISISHTINEDFGCRFYEKDNEG